jgi:hypothetical protein
LLNCESSELNFAIEDFGGSVKISAQYRRQLMSNKCRIYPMVFILILLTVMLYPVIAHAQTPLPCGVTELGANNV